MTFLVSRNIFQQKPRLDLNPDTVKKNNEENGHFISDKKKNFSITKIFMCFIFQNIGRNIIYFLKKNPCLLKPR